MNIAIIRHGMTQGNAERRYIGSTDEPLCAAGEAELLRLAELGAYPVVTRAYVSPLLRCRQTCALAFPGVEEQVTEDLREQAFGVFENRTYEELQFLPAYRAWLDAAGDAEIPQGEGGPAFRARCRAAFCTAVGDGLLRGGGDIAIVAHGGVLMAALSAHARPERDFYGWQVQNACGFLLHVDAGLWERERTVQVLRAIGEGAM